MRCLEKTPSTLCVYRITPVVLLYTFMYSISTKELLKTFDVLNDCVCAAVGKNKKKKKKWYGSIWIYYMTVKKNLL
jgi:hypothetical protein